MRSKCLVFVWFNHQSTNRSTWPCNTHDPEIGTPGGSAIEVNITSSTLKHLNHPFMELP